MNDSTLVYFKRTNISSINLLKLKKKINLLKINNINDLKKIKNKNKVVAIYADQNFIFSKNIINKFISLKFFLSSTTSTNFIDENYCKKKNIRILSLQNEQKFLKKITPTAEHIFGLIFLITRNYTRAIDSVNKGLFDRKFFAGKKMLSRSSLGIIGYGRLGKLLKKISKGFNLTIFTADKKEKNFKKKLKYLINNSDIISLNIPLKNNYYFFSKKNFPKINNSFYLVNTSSGDVVEEKFIINLFKKKTLLGYGTDVISKEFKNNFNLKKNLIYKNRKKYNIIITPHIGGSTKDAWKLTQSRVIKNFLNLI